MISYFKNFISLFEKPRLSENYSDIRSVHPLELFFDLIFVAAMAKLGHLLHDPTISGLFIVFIMYITVYQIWYNITLYNVYYFGSSYFTKVFLFLGMLPIVFLVGTSDVTTIDNIYIITTAFSVSRFSLALMWLISIDCKSIDKDVLFMNREAKYHIITYSISGVIALVPLFDYRLFVFSLVSALLVEFIVIAIKNFVKEVQHYEMFNYNLLKERQILFLIIIWGEGIVLITNSLANSIATNRLAEGITLFIILFIYFIRTVEEYELSAPNENNVTYYVLSHFVFVFLNLLLFISLGEIVNGDSIVLVNRIVIMFSLLIITVWHFFNNIMMHNDAINYEDMQKYKNVDNIMLLFQLVLLPILFFIENNLAFIMIVLIYFILLIIATPYRYKCIKELRKYSK